MGGQVQKQAYDKNEFLMAMAADYSDAMGSPNELWRLRALRRFQRYAKNLTPYQRKDKRSYPHHIIANADLARAA